MEEKTRSILLVDDDEATNIINKMVIEKFECFKQINIAYNGREALEHLQTLRDNNFYLPDFILLDINMPEMDGWEFLQHFKKMMNYESLKLIILLMLTTSMDPLDEKEALQNPYVNGFLTKPLKQENLRQYIKSY